jgi:hypothetical protein
MSGQDDSGRQEGRQEQVGAKMSQEQPRRGQEDNFSPYTAAQTHFLASRTHFFASRTHLFASGTHLFASGTHVRV